MNLYGVFTLGVNIKYWFFILPYRHMVATPVRGLTQKYAMMW